MRILADLHISFRTVSLRLSSARVETVNERLLRTLPMIEHNIGGGALVVVEDSRIRVRALPVG